MSKISRGALLEMACKAGYQHPDASEDFESFDLYRFAELVLAARVPVDGVPASAYRDAADTIEQIKWCSQHCDCPSFGIANDWINATHGGTMFDDPSQQQQREEHVAQDWQTELLDLVSACQSAYYIDNAEGHRFGGIVSNLEENRAGIVEFVSELLQSAHSTPPAVAIPAGYKLVPAEPTDEMCDAAAEGEGSEFIGEFRCIGRFDIAYKDALAAAPQPPVVSADELVAAEREACARVAEGSVNATSGSKTHIAAAIRARSEK